MIRNYLIICLLIGVLQASKIENKDSFLSLLVENGKVTNNSSHVEVDNLLRKLSYPSYKNKALNKISNLADNGDSYANFILGTFYESKNKITLSEKYYLRAIKLGSYEAAYNIGILYLNINNIEKAKKYLNISLENGILQAIIPLSDIEVDPNKKIKLLELAVNNGLEGSKRLLTIELIRQNKIDRAYKLSLEMFNDSENYILLYKLTIAKNTKRALEILEKGVLVGDIESMELLSFLYLKGKYVKKDLKKAEAFVSKLDTPIANLVKGLVYFENKDNLKKSYIELKKFKLKTNSNIVDNEINFICEKTNYCLEF